MFHRYACSNCGCSRTTAFNSDQFQTCIRCDECGHIETRDDSDFDGDLVAVEQGM